MPFSILQRNYEEEFIEEMMTRRELYEIIGYRL